jgi:rod shape determining protein RodA
VRRDAFISEKATIWLANAVAGAVALPLWNKLQPYQKNRFMVFLDPMVDPRGAGYNLIQSRVAIGSGGWFGRGWLHGPQKRLAFLPEQHTDFIFSVWAEEHGFVGCLLLLALYFALVTSAMDIAGNARDRFGHFLAVGLAGMLFWQVFINVGMVIGVLPVVGVTLPLMSYGGSSVLVIYTAIGLLANVGMRRFVN